MTLPKLCARAPEFVKAYDHPSAYRTSNMIDRHMDRMDRSFYTAKYFHGNHDYERCEKIGWIGSTRVGEGVTR